MKDIMQEYMNEYLPLRDVVFRTLRQGILTGELKPGERLMEIHLADRLGVSRTPIREAIRKLELEGLVTMVPRKGAEVAKISAKNLKDVLEVRVALETLAIRLACERITPEGLEELKQACDNFEQTTKNDSMDVTSITKADVALHDVIVRATGNERLTQMIYNLQEQMYRYRFEYIKDTAYHALLIQEHTRIYESIRDGQVDKAVEEITKHIENQLHTIIKQLETE